MVGFVLLTSKPPRITASFANYPPMPFGNPGEDLPAGPIGWSAVHIRQSEDGRCVAAEVIPEFISAEVLCAWEQ